MRNTFVFMILVFFFISICNGKQDSTINIKPLILKKDSTGLSEAKAYKMLYENQMKSNDAILKTIYYALGGLGSAVLLVFASNWWFNEKKVKDTAAGINSQISEAKNAALSEVREKINSFSTEKNTEINQLLKNLQSDITASITSITLKHSELTEKLRSEIKEDNKSLTVSFDDRIKSYSDNLLMQIKTLENIVSEKFESQNEKNSILEKTINQKYDKKIGLLESKINIESNRIKRDVYKTTAELAETNNLFSKAFRNHLGVAITEEKLGMTTTEYTLRPILESLEKADYIWSDEEDDLLKLLKNVVGNDELKKGINDTLKKKKIEKI